MNLVNGNLSLKPITMDDIECLHDYASKPIVSKYIGWPLMKSLEETKAFYKTLEENEEKKTHVYAFVYDNDMHVGTVMLFSFNKDAKNAEIGYVFHPKAWGKNIASLAVKMLKSYAFDVLDLHKVFARVASGNIASAKVLEKNDFMVEGVLKDQYKIENTYEDLIYYASFNE